jgi:hypothetical protein
MKKVYQTIVDKDHGNCMQAVVASLFNLNLEDVPNFIEYDDWWSGTVEFFNDRGYDWNTIWINHHSEDELEPIMPIELVKECLKADGGVNGYWYAFLPSATFPYPGTHAVIVDAECNVIHDPNPNEKCLGFDYTKIIGVHTVKHDWYIDDGKLVMIK